MEDESAGSHHYGLDAMHRQQNRELYVSMKSNERSDAKVSNGDDLFSPSENFRRESIMTKTRKRGNMGTGGIGSVISGKPIIQPDGSV
jgi:hypothetical protein